MARAKQTGRSEARRRYRQSMAPTDADGEGEVLEPGDDAEPKRLAAKAAPARPADNRPPSGRLGFGASFRLAYHPPNIREDIRTLPTTLQSRGFIAAVLMVIIGGVLQENPLFVPPTEYLRELQSRKQISRPTLN